MVKAETKSKAYVVFQDSLRLKIKGRNGNHFQSLKGSKGKAMSGEYRQIDCVGWWEEKTTGCRARVLMVHNGFAFYEMQTGGCQCAEIKLLSKSYKHLPNCTGWDWQPEPTIEEIEFPDWVLPEYEWLATDKNGLHCVCAEKPELDLQGEYWIPPRGCFLAPLRAVDKSWVPAIPDGGWQKAILKRKAKVQNAQPPHGQCVGSSVNKIDLRNLTDLERIELTGLLKVLSDDRHNNAVIDRINDILKIAANSKQPDPEGWIEWAGGDCPVQKDVMVDVKRKDGFWSFNQRAIIYRWEHIGYDGDIVAYRVKGGV